MNKKLLTVLLATAALMPLASVFAAENAGGDDDIASLRAEIARLSKQVSKLETKQKQTAAQVSEQNQKIAEVATPAAEGKADDKTPAGFFHVPGTDTALKVGGYVKLDAMLSSNGYTSPFARFFAIPLDHSPTDQQSMATSFSAQQSRLNFETRTQTGWGEVKTFIEGDFYGSNAGSGNTNGYGFQLRHAYGSLGPLLVGQTWSNYMDVDAASESLDYLGAVGRVFVRQAQIRYTHDFGPVKASASVEAALGNDSNFTPNSGISGVGGAAVSTHSSMPDFTLRGDYKYSDTGYVSLRGLFTQLNADRTVGVDNHTDTEYGYSVGVSGKQGVFDKDSINYDINYGEGTGRYIFDIGSAGNYFNTTTGDLETQDFFAATLGYRHVWSDKFYSNFFGGYVRNYNDTAFSGASANKYVASGHANLFYQPAKAFKVGVEYMHGYRVIQNGQDGDLDRVETSFIYNF